MKFIRALFVAAALAACGGEENDPPDPAPPPTDNALLWAGTYNGTQHIISSCTDGSGGTQDAPLSGLPITRASTNVINLPFNPINPCLVPFDVTSSTATGRRTVCPPFTREGVTSTATFTSGAFTRNGRTITGTISFSISSDVGVSCTGTNSLSISK
jgi:hypothetical protein